MARPGGDILRIVGLTREARLADGPAVVGVTELPARLAVARAAISFGLCGALAPGLQAGDLVIGEAVVFDGGSIRCDGRLTACLAAALPGARVGPVAGVERIVGSAREKAALWAAGGALAADMESLAVARAAAHASVPFAVLRAVSDGSARSLPASAMAGFSVSGDPEVGRVLLALVRRPWELLALIRTAFEAEAGFRALAAAARVIDSAVDGALALRDAGDARL